MYQRLRGWAAIALGVFGCALPGLATAWEMAGTKEIALHTRDGQAIAIGSITFRPQGERIGFSLHVNQERFKDFFLSMKEFKCLEGQTEILCLVPYPYAHPASVTRTDLAWLEHSLLFLHKRPADYGARLSNGFYYRMTLTDEGIDGTPEAIDFNLISAPPTVFDVPPYGPMERSELASGSRWVTKLTIR